MEWDVEFHDDFEGEFDDLSEAVQDAILAEVNLLAKVGPSLKRPHADTLNGSKHANMKELRCNADDGNGGSPLPSTPSARPYCWRRETRQALMRSASTKH